MASYPSLSRAGKFEAKLQHVAKYPLAKQIEQEISRPKISKYMAQPVNPALCDDIIGYIEPELASYKGCDILDLNPGACLWTTKLHEHLKPRVHLLAEPPGSKYFDPFIKPLLEQKRSKYRHVALNPNVITDLYAENLFGDGRLPPGEQRFSPENQINKKLLVTGNYSCFPHRHSLAYAAVLGNILRLSQEGQCMHAYGAPKMLFWVGNDYKGFFSPRSTRYRRLNNLRIDKGLTPVEICSAPQRSFEGHGLSSREYRLDEESRRRTQARMEAAGITMPECRKVEERREDIVIPEELVDEDLLAGKPGKGTSRMYTRNPISNKTDHDLGPVDWHWGELDYYLRKYIRIKEEVRKLEKDMGLEKIIAEEDAEWRAMQQDGKKVVSKTVRLERKKKVKEVQKTQKILERFGGANIFFSGILKSTTSPLHRMLRGLRSHVRFRLRSKVLIGKLVLAAEALRNYKTSLKAQGIDFTAHDFDEKHSESYLTLRELQAAVKDIKDKVNTWASIAEYHALEDDRHSMQQDPVLLPWDRRPYEPLQVNPEEFYPNHALSLISFTPHELAPSRVSQDFHWTYRLMIGILLRGAYDTNIVDALEGVAPGASEYLIPMVPEITDPSKGGMADPKDMRVRLLTVEMALKLTEAWLESPLRQESGELGALSSNDDPHVRQRGKRFEGR